MTTTLDQAVTAAQVAEATYNSDVTNVATIEQAIASATAPLAPAQVQLGSDTTTFISTLQAVSEAALAEIATLQGTSTQS